MLIGQNRLGLLRGRNQTDSARHDIRFFANSLGELLHFRSCHLRLAIGQLRVRISLMESLVQFGVDT